MDDFKGRILMRDQAENKTLQDAAKKDHADWDEKWEQMLWQLQDYQEEKDHPQAQVVNVELDELSVRSFTFWFISDLWD